MKKIKFLVSRLGQVTILDAKGYGTSCQAATARIEQRLGAVDESTRAATEGMYKQVQDQGAYQEQG